MGEDILSVIFLVFICIVIGGIAKSLLPVDLLLPSFVLIATCTWIALDYILLQRHKALNACSHKQKVAEKVTNYMDDAIDKLLNDNTNNPTNDNANNPTNDDANNPTNDNANNHTNDNANDNANDHANSDHATKQHDGEFDIDLYQGKTVEELYQHTGCSGDNRIANRMKYMGLQAQMSQEIRARHNVEKLRPYFEEELEEGENRDWWDNDNDLDNLM